MVKFAKSKLLKTMIQRIWINQNGVQSGPFTMEELAARGPLSRNTYVWFKGMADWQRIDEVPELAAMMQPLEAAEAEAETEATVAEAAALPPDMPPVPELPPQPQNAQPPQYAPMPQYAQQPAMVPKRPPHNLFWSVVAVIFCCSIPAIVAIVYGALVTSKYNQGDYAKAQKYSDISAWWCIAAIVLGVISLPISILMTMMQ